ncbi:nucleoside/nucleotide kinase family protein [Nocardioides xinjiangensis]|uniref:4-amino-4-deoxy-L-arabinose transferase n=1 Tax=Nocardioides xinjiangensis TaxID=2817376 RepID=UPI001B30E728|nr:4-amino-4-deoxy-L-arabinose transferase [Nocardioides sp. SYSU D00778]
MTADPHHVARTVADLVHAGPPTLGTGRLVCIDGPAGSGKTTLAAALAELVPRAHVVHSDELLEGWRGLPGLAATVTRLLTPLAGGEPGRWRRWDWHADGWAESREVRPGGLLVLEGVGCWSPAIGHLVGVLVWLEADPGVRLARALERDGDYLRAHWDQWRTDESELFERYRTRSRADFVVRTD